MKNVSSFVTSSKTLWSVLILKYTLCFRKKTLEKRLLWIPKRKWRGNHGNHGRKYYEVTNWIKIALDGILKGVMQFPSIISENRTFKQI